MPLIAGDSRAEKDGEGHGQDLPAGSGTRLVNWVFAGMTRAGAGASYRLILTVRGRRTGRPRSTPVDVIETDGDRWLVAGYGPTSWVLNARAAGEATLRRGRSSRRYTVTEPASGRRPRAAQIHGPDPGHPAVLRRRTGLARRRRQSRTARHPVFQLTPARPS